MTPSPAKSKSIYFPTGWSQNTLKHDLVTKVKKKRERKEAHLCTASGATKKVERVAPHVKHILFFLRRPRDLLQGIEMKTNPKENAIRGINLSLVQLCHEYVGSRTLALIRKGGTAKVNVNVRISLNSHELACVFFQKFNKLCAAIEKVTNNQRTESCSKFVSPSIPDNFLSYNVAKKRSL